MSLAFLVDGLTEQRFIQSICPGRPVQRLNLNGNTVSAEAIAERAASQVRIWGGRYHPVIVLVDHESRQLSHQAFARDLLAAISVHGVGDQVRVCVAKRMIENWIIADSELVGWENAPESVDDLHGATHLRRLLKEYDKAGDGPELLRRARPSRMRLRSPSFDSAFTTLVGLRCPWLER